MQGSEASAGAVVHYLPNGRFGRVAVPLLVLAVFAGTVFGGVLSLRTVHLLCDRGLGTCSIVSSWGPVSTARTVPIESIRKTRLDTSRGKNGVATYEVVLVTSDGDARLSMVSSSNSAQRGRAKSDIDTFLANPKNGSLDVDYDEPDRTGMLLLALSLVWLYAAWAMSRSARVEIDRANGTCTVVAVRWPLPPARRVFELADVRDAVVREGGKRNTYNLALVVDGYEEVLVFGWASSGRAWKDAAAAEIRALLAR